jgi:hypothetical protein
MMESSPPSAGAATAGRRLRVVTHSGLVRLSVARFLVALVLLVIAAPFIEHFRNGVLVETGLVTLAMCMGVFAVGARRQTLMLAIILASPAVLGNWANHLWPESYPMEAVLAARLVFLGFIMSHLMRFILRARRVDSEVLCAGISIYLLLGLLWTFAYTLVARVTPDAFAFSVPASAGHSMTGFTAFYFSIITLTTVGYGDVTPVSNVARMLAMLEAMTGTLFVGVLIARLVSLYSSEIETGRPSSRPADGPAQPEAQAL